MLRHRCFNFASQEADDPRKIRFLYAFLPTSLAKKRRGIVGFWSGLAGLALPFSNRFHEENRHRAIH